MNIILSGGGTAGHINPAVAVAEELKRQMGDDVKLLFVGARGKMEMSRIPKLGYDIVGLPIAGLQRRLTLRNILRNLALPFKLWQSQRQARKIIRDFGADVVVGFGGYASAPVLRTAQAMGIPTIIQEQNSYAGLTNKKLGERAKNICVAYEGMDRFFPSDRITLTGNPLRGSFGEMPDKKEALEYFGLSGEKPVVLIVGGSLGSRTLNEAVMRYIDDPKIRDKVQLIWQTGSYYAAQIKERTKETDMTGVWCGAYIERMDLAFSAADVVVSRSGATTISELCLVGKATIFVPSPNVAEDHQRKNAEALVDRSAAMMFLDGEAVEKVLPAAVELTQDRARIATLEANIKELATPNAAHDIVRLILDYNV